MEYLKVVWQALLGFLPLSENCQTQKWDIFAVLMLWLDTVACLPMSYYFWEKSRLLH